MPVDQCSWRSGKDLERSFLGVQRIVRAARGKAFSQAIVFSERSCVLEFSLFGGEMPHASAAVVEWSATHYSALWAASVAEQLPMASRAFRGPLKSIVDGLKSL